MSQLACQSHRSTVEQFAQGVSSRGVSKLDKFLEADVQKTCNSKVVYKNIQEAQDYYSKESASPWKVLEVIEDDTKVCKPAIIQYTSSMSQSASQSHKSTVEQFAQAVITREVSKLDKFLEADVQKTYNSKVVYKNIQEAQDYYSKENTSQWKVLEVIENDTKGNTIQIRISDDNKRAKISYTFGPSGKIHRIDTVPEN